MALSMEDYNCDWFSITIKFKASSFKKKEFLVDVKSTDEEIDGSRYYYGSKLNEGKDHSHITFFFDKESSSINISYHRGKTPAEDVREPFMEDCSEWLSQFFKKNPTMVDYTVVYRYGKDFESIVPLDYPLHSPKKVLKGASVAGYQIEFPKGALVDSAFITAKKGVKLVILSAEKKDLDLLKRDFYSNLEEFTDFAKSLVIKGVK